MNIVNRIQVFIRTQLTVPRSRLIVAYVQVTRSRTNVGDSSGKQDTGSMGDDFER